MMKKRICALCFLVMLLLFASGCSRTESDKPISEPAPEQTELSAKEEQPVLPEKEDIASEKEQDAAQEEQDITQEEQKDDSARNAAYTGLLKDLIDHNVWPDGEEASEAGFGEMEENRFAIADIDGDGQDEILVEILTTSMFRMSVRIYDYDEETQELHFEYGGFPSIRVYDNGIIQQDASHNHSLGLELWPFSIVQYDPDEDFYDYIDSAHSWEKEVSEEDYDGTRFPDDIDADGDGIVYFLMSLDKYVDAAEYQEWLNSYMNGATEIELQWKNITIENI